MNLTHTNAKVGQRIRATEWASVPQGWEGIVTKVDGQAVSIKFDKGGREYANFRAFPCGTGVWDYTILP